MDGGPKPLDVAAHPDRGAHDQNDAIRHTQRRSHLAGETGRAWGIEQIERGVFEGTVKDAGIE